MDYADNIAEHQFGWIDYISFILTIVASAIVGIYFGCFKKSQNTVASYLLGNKNVSLFPVAISLIVSNISGLSLLGLPTEMYLNGSQFWFNNIAYIWITLIAIYIFNPMFYKLQLVSFNEYYELRFSKKVRKISSLLFAFDLLTFLPIVMYGVTLAINQVTGLNKTAITVSLCLLCTFYTTLGGFRAVVWTDAIQGSIMLISAIILLVTGITESNGISSIMDNAKKSGRLEIFNMNPDPRIRLSFWSSIIGYPTLMLSATVLHPLFVQRCLALKKEIEVKWAILIFSLGMVFFTTTSSFLGLIAYDRYKGCDPLTVGAIEKPDQILPYLVFDIAKNVNGLPGIFIAANVSAALSTMSSGVNTIGGIIFEDLIRPLFKKNLTEAAATGIIKLIVVILSTLIIFGVFAIENLGTILELAVLFGSVLCGTTMGMLILGSVFPITNTKGAIWGSTVGILLSIWIVTGYKLAMSRGLIHHQHLPLSVVDCPANFTVINSTETNIAMEYESSYFQFVFPLYQITEYYYGLICCIVVVAVGLAVSWTSREAKDDVVNPDLFVPFVRKIYCRKLANKEYRAVEELTKQDILL